MDSNHRSHHEPFLCLATLLSSSHCSDASCCLMPSEAKFDHSLLEGTDWVYLGRWTRLSLHTNANQEEGNQPKWIYFWDTLQHFKPHNLTFPKVISSSNHERRKVLSHPLSVKLFLFRITVLLTGPYSLLWIFTWDHKLAVCLDGCWGRECVLWKEHALGAHGTLPLTVGQTWHVMSVSVSTSIQWYFTGLWWRLK